MSTPIVEGPSCRTLSRPVTALKSLFPKMVLAIQALLRSQRLRSASERLANRRSDHFRFAPVRFARWRSTRPKSAPERLAASRSAFLSVDPKRLASWRLAPLSFAARRLVQLKFDLSRFAARRSATARLAPVKLAAPRFARLRSGLWTCKPESAAPRRSAPLAWSTSRCAWLRSGLSPGLRLLHSFQASTPREIRAICPLSATSGHFRGSRLAASVAVLPKFTAAGR